MKKLLLCALLLSGVYSATSRAVTINVTLDPGPVGSTLPAQTIFQLPELVGFDLQADDLTVNVMFADGRLLGISSVINAILQVTTDPAGGFGTVTLAESGIFASNGSSVLLGSITNTANQTVNLFGGGPLDLASVRYGGLTGSGVVTSATFMIFESALVIAGPRTVDTPATLPLLALGLLVLAGLSKRRRRV
jgi:hypothetical protein